MNGKRRRFRGQITYGNVVATLALFVALGGTGYAVSALPKDSVGARQIKRNAVGPVEIKAGAVGTSEVADGSLLSADFAPGGLPRGPAGPRGADGEDGEPGPPGPTFAAIANGNDPVAAPDFPLPVELSFSTPSEGKLLVTVAANPEAAFQGVRVDCSPGSPNVGLYLDGVPVPDTVIALQDNVGQAFTTFGVTSSPVAAGSHQLSLRADCAGGSPVTATVSGNTTASAVLLGS